MDTRPSWDEYFYTLSKAAQRRANCTRRQAGAVIYDERNRVVSIGYNGAAAGQPGCLSDGACPRGQLSDDQLAAYSNYDSGPGFCPAIHAESNAILNAGRPVVGMSLWTTSSRSCGQPCQGCWRTMAGAGIVSVKWLEDDIIFEGNPTLNGAVTPVRLGRATWDLTA